MGTDKLPQDYGIHVLEELRGLRHELVAIRETLDEFCRVFLASKFRYGKPTDRFGRSPNDWRRS